MALVDDQTPASVSSAQVKNSSNEQSSSEETDSPDPLPPLSVAQKRRKMDKLLPLRFHVVCGDNVVMNRTCVTACRDESNNTSAYVFTERTIKNNERVWIRIMEVVPPSDGSLAVGVTTVDPATLRLPEMPEDMSKLVMKPGYWDFKLDAASKLNDKSILSFWIDESDQVWCDIDFSKTQMCFQMDRKSEDIYMFFAMSGSSKLIRLLGVSKVRTKLAIGRTARTNTLTTRSQIKPVETRKSVQPSSSEETEAKSPVDTSNVVSTALSPGNKTVPQVSDTKNMTMLTTTTKSVIKAVGSLNHGCNGMSRRIRKYYQRADGRGTLDKFYSAVLEKSFNGNSSASTEVKNQMTEKKRPTLSEATCMAKGAALVETAGTSSGGSDNLISQNLTTNQVTSTNGICVTTTTSQQSLPAKQTMVHGCIGMSRRMRKYLKRTDIRGTLDKFYSIVLEKIAKENLSASTEAENQPLPESSHMTKRAPAVDHTVLQNLTAKQVDETLNPTTTRHQNPRVVRYPVHGCIGVPRRMRKYLKRTDIRGTLDKFYSIVFE